MHTDREEELRIKVEELQADYNYLERLKNQSDRGIDLLSKEITRRENELKLKDKTIGLYEERLKEQKLYKLIFVVMFVSLALFLLLQNIIGNG